MGALWDVEVEPEVPQWLHTLPLGDYRTVEFHADRLAESPTTLGEPYSKHLRGPVRGLRFHLGRAAWRVTYWLAPDRRIVLLTVFRKTRSSETAEVARAVLAQRICEDKRTRRRRMSMTGRVSGNEGLPHQVDGAGRAP